jgi:hypothetical protein
VLEEPRIAGDVVAFVLMAGGGHSPEEVIREAHVSHLMSLECWSGWDVAPGSYRCLVGMPAAARAVHAPDTGMLRHAHVDEVTRWESLIRHLTY